MVERGADEHEIELGDDDPVLQVPDAGCGIAGHGDFRMGDPVFGDDTRAECLAQVVDQVGAVGEVQLRTDR
ncbi:Uncharacterised protein [Mycobacterium tuberculosis]|nr:Uncharacterised protein [Mycobacterium tuberculosis]CKT40243.1 Uncharacterised protein [Mycobacterium tuberculosis]COW61153.1 Uncharacterised protein [Mycobacterium tuberculosis]COX04329.1 Uncharacterised protein [Mycobacterium tuberculosis]COX70425.1 Uncharacterised protein [Mycobacterium tuberculosis]